MIVTAPARHEVGASSAVGRIVTKSSQQGIVAARQRHRIVARTGEDKIIAICAGDGIVTGIAKDDVGSSDSAANTPSTPCRLVVGCSGSKNAVTSS